jgi:acetyltransferase-like isoleucine patch superfamily enzyme
MGACVHRIRTLFWTAFYRVLGRCFFERLGRGVRFEGWIDIPQRGGRIVIGDGVHIARGVEFSVTRGAELSIGDRVFIGRGVVISSHQRVCIQDDVLVAEYVCLHDNNHKTADRSQPVAAQGFESEQLVIGRGSWIGARAVLVKGAQLGERCVVGAGAVVTRAFLIEGQTLLGVPARSKSASA